ncbi:hypothetical protein N0V95_003555, partial [Ascochyta clinopodiicola]
MDPTTTTQDSDRDIVDAIVHSLELSMLADSPALPPDSGAGTPLVDSLAYGLSMEKGDGECECVVDLTHQRPEDSDSPPVDDWALDPAEAERSRLSHARERMVSSIPYLTISSTGEEQTHHTTASRAQTHHMLQYFQHLHSHLLASTEILNTYAPTAFQRPHLVPGAVPDDPASEVDIAQLARDQVLFTYHHNAVSETLQSVQ